MDEKTEWRNRNSAKSVAGSELYELYYSHWCANTLPKDLFWGEQHAIKFIEMQKQVDKSGWLDDVWAEGGAIVDLDKKKLVFYGGEDILYNVPLRNLYLKLMRTIWSGWEIAWAYEGILDLANYVGYPKEKILTYGEDDLKDGSLEPPEEKDWVDTIASVMFPQNELLLFPLSGGVEVYLAHGPNMIHGIDKSCGYKSIALREWSKEFPVGGFHIDIERRRLEFWHANGIPNISHELKSKWSGWEVVHHYGDYESHLKSTTGQLQFQNIDQNQLLEDLKSQLLWESSNPVDTLTHFAKKEAEAGRNVEINPLALRYDTYELSKEIKEEILQRAIDSLL